MAVNPPPPELPKYPYIWYLDGNSAQLLSQREKTDAKGITISELYIRPTKELMQRFKITEDKLDTNNALWVEYPSLHLRRLNESPINGRVLVMCDYEGADLTWKLDPDGLRRMIITLQQLISQQQATIAALYEEMGMMGSSQEEWIAKKARMFENIRKMGGMNLSSDQLAKIMKGESIMDAKSDESS